MKSHICSSMAVLIGVVLVGATLGACGGDRRTVGDDRVFSRASVERAFNANDEPLVVAVDFDRAAPESPIQAILVPKEENETDDPTLSVEVLESEAAADRNIVAWEKAKAATEDEEFAQYLRKQNVIVFFDERLSQIRRKRVESALSALN